MTPSDTLLLHEKIHRALDLLEGRLVRMEADQDHQQALLNQRIELLEQQHQDQEGRLRTVMEGVIRLNTRASLAAVGQSLLSLILAAIAAYLGAR